VSDRYRFIYIRLPKASSSSVVRALRRMLCPNVHACPPDLLEQRSLSEVSAEKWAAYIVFTAVRNPFTRAASAYSFLTARHLFNKLGTGNDAPRGKPCAVPFSEFAASSHALSHRRVCAVPPHCCAFVEDTGWVEHFVDLHISDQAHAVFDAAGRNAVDFIARTEHLVADMAEVVRIINAREGSALNITIKQLNAGPHLDAAAVHKRMYDAATMRGVAKQYAVDLLRFGFLEPLATATG